MTREWYLIDDDGIHPLNMDNEPIDFWKKFQDEDDDEAPWPPFNQLAVEAAATEVVEVLRRTAPSLNVELDDITDRPERWAGGLVVSEASELTLVGEPGVDLDDRAVALPWSEALVEELGCDGAFFGYDPAAGTLHLTMFSDGAPDFAWCDSLKPGPSYAMVFDGDGRCTEEDPRRYALRMLELPETSPFLDRYQFVLSRLKGLGLDTVSPELDNFPIAAVMSVRIISQVETGEPG